MLDQPALLNLLDQGIAHAEQEYVIHTGNQTACQLHKDGRVTGGLKYDEGQLVALTDLRRALRKLGSADAAAVHAAIQQHLTRWERALATYQAAERPSIPWIAYNQGGVDATAYCLSQLDATP